MPLHLSSDGSRSVTITVDVPGSPEEVWRAVASGPGVSSWFVPTTFDADAAGAPRAMTNDFGRGMRSHSTITSWDPPRAFTAECPDLGPDAPPVLTEWRVEPRGDGDVDGCTVRVTHRVETASNSWDVHLEAWESGWPAFFALLRFVLEQFRDEPCDGFYCTGSFDDADEAWEILESAMDLADRGAGDEFEARGDAPDLAGRVGRDEDARERLLRLDRPAPGMAHLFVMPAGDRATVWMRFAFFGDDATEVADAERPRWEEWFAERFGEVQRAR